MQAYQKEFIQFALDSAVLRFGRFVLKSGRESPYFFNSGLFDSGGSLARLGGFYADAVVDSGLDFDMLYGAAYKGIPLVSATAMALAQRHGRDVPYCFDRKEAKDHGEEGRIVGAPLEGRVLMVDDVISAGTSVREAVGLIRDAGAQAAGVVIALDRQERGSGPESAIGEIAERYGLQVVSLITLAQIIEYLEQKPDLSGALEQVRAYGSRYGVSEFQGSSPA